MAKDGTCRGGARAGAGRKSKALADKLAEGNPGKHELTVIEFKNMEDLKGEDMPKPSRMLSAKQKDGKKLPAAGIKKRHGSGSRSADAPCSFRRSFSKGTR